MPITIDRPLILSEVQVKEFDYVRIFKGPEGLRAEVGFVIKNEAGAICDSQVLTYSGEDYNNFWDNFNNGKFLYEELVKDEEDVEIPEDIEESFKN